MKLPNRNISGVNPAILHKNYYLKIILMEIPFIDIHTHQSNKTENSILITNLFLQDVKGVVSTLFSAALHPWHSDLFSVKECTTMLDNLSQQPYLFAIGETGLDRSTTVGYDIQKRIFETHINFAERIQKPLIIHAVKSWNEMITYLIKLKVPFILHGYSANKEITKQLLKFDGYFSLGKSVLTAPSARLEIFKSIPDDRLFLETDESDCQIEEVYQFIAKLRGITVEELKTKLYHNFKKISPVS